MLFGGNTRLLLMRIGEATEMRSHTNTCLRWRGGHGTFNFVF